MPDARIQPIIDSFASVIRAHSRIIDIGAGKGLLAKEMTQRLDACVTIVDVAQYNQTNLPLVVCDSRALAFDANSFDYAVLSFVLHHCPSPADILQEALRVAPEAIVIENHVTSRLRGWLTRLFDSWPALRYGTPPCYFVRDRSEWLQWFDRFGLDAQELGTFSLEHGFFDCFTVHLKRRGNDS